MTEALLQLLRRRPPPGDPSLAPWLPHLTVLLRHVLTREAVLTSALPLRLRRAAASAAVASGSGC